MFFYSNSLLNFDPVRTRQFNALSISSRIFKSRAGKVSIQCWGVHRPPDNTGADGGTRTPTGLRPTDFRTTSVFTAAIGRSWSGLSLHRSHSAVGAARLVSTPSPREGLGSGLASAALEAFPEFERFYTRCFHRGTQFPQVRCVYQFHHVRFRTPKCVTNV